MKKLNIRWQLTLWYGAVLTLIVAGFGSSVYLMLQQHLLARTDFELEEELGELVLEVSLASDAQELKRQLQQRFFQHASFDLQVSPRASNHAHSMIFRSQRLEAESLPIPKPSGPANSTASIKSSYRLKNFGETRVASRMAKGPSGEYIVQATISLRPMRDELAAVMDTMLTAGLLVIAAALLGGYGLAKRALSPVDNMATIAQQITGMRLADRIAIANPSDELGHLARTFNSMLDRLQRAVEQLRRFTADAAHELRTPLAVLQTESEVALRLEGTIEDYRRVAEVTLMETKRLGKLAERLLLLSRFDGDLQWLPHEDVPLDALVADVVDQFRLLAESQRIAIQFETVSELMVKGDDIQLSQLVFNLIENAVKFTRPDGAIVIQLQPAQNLVRLSVTDTGIGIAQADLSHVFERFYRADLSRSGCGGAGLGLAICRAIAEAHAGRIGIESSLGQGTRVWVELPIAW